MRVSVVIPAWNAAATLPRTLAAVAAQRLDEPYEVVVVDNGSDDGTAAVLDAAPEPVRAVRREVHGLAGEARNDGVAASSGELLAFTDADCFPEPGWLAAGLRALADADLVQGRVRPDPGARMGPFDRSLWVERHDGLYQTANLFVRRSAFDAVGGFEELHEDASARAFGEDVWLGWRVRRTGARVAFCADAVVSHAVLPRGPAAYVAERRRLAGFPALVARVPELRRELLLGGVFLSRRTAAFDAAVVGALAAGTIRRRAGPSAALRSRLPLLAALPYAVTIARRSLQSGRRAPLVAPAEVAADAVGLAALLGGSLRHRTLVL